MRRALSILLTSLALTSAVPSWATAETPRQDRAIRLLLTCLSDQSRREPGVEMNLQAATYRIADDPISGADRLNGYTYIGEIVLSIPFRDGPREEWQDTNFIHPQPINLEEKNGFMEVVDFELIPGVRKGAHCRSAKAQFY